MGFTVCSIMDRLPTIIQGGMGAGVSSWRLAQAVSKLGQLGVVSGTALDVILARRLQDGDPGGHDNPVGINYLEKVQLPHLPSIYGAMLAGVGYVLMGAGVPLRIPGVLDRLSHHEPATYLLQVTGAQENDDRTMTFTPKELMGCDLPPLHRPKFLAIIASNTLATTMLK